MLIIFSFVSWNNVYHEGEKKLATKCSLECRLFVSHRTRYGFISNSIVQGQYFQSPFFFFIPNTFVLYCAHEIGDLIVWIYSGQANARSSNSNIWFPIPVTFYIYRSGQALLSDSFRYVLDRSSWCNALSQTSRVDWPCHWLWFNCGAQRSLAHGMFHPFFQQFCYQRCHYEKGVVNAEYSDGWLLMYRKILSLEWWPWWRFVCLICWISE